MPSHRSCLIETCRALSTVGLVAFLSACTMPMDEEAPTAAPSAATPERGSRAPSAAQLEGFVAAGARAKAVFVGEVVAIDQRLSQPDDNGRVLPFRFVTWRVDRAVRGIDKGTTWTGRFAGGNLPDGRTLWVSEVPEFELGQHALLLADDGDAGSCALVGCRDGMLTLDAGGAANVELPVLTDARATRVRSAIPDAPFAFSPRRRASQAELDAARLAGRARLQRAVPTQPATDPRELEAMTKNGFDPVLR
jgi:hypothetical protein